MRSKCQLPRPIDTAATLAAALVITALVPPAIAQPAGGPAPGTVGGGVGGAVRGDPVDRAIARGIDFLLHLQHDAGPLTGVIHDAGSHQNVTAMTALSIMAMAAVGDQPHDPTPQGRAIRQGLEFVLHPRRQDRFGYFGIDGSRMYGHGIITLMLGEMLGMGTDDEQDLRIRRSLDRAIALTLMSQRVRKDGHHRGGWRYGPDARDSDLSVTVWQVMALRSAHNAGLDVPSEAIDQAVGYIQRCYDRRNVELRPTSRRRVSGFAYQPGGHRTYSTAAAGLLSMQVCGRYEAEEVMDTSDWLLDEELRFENGWFFYGTYYYAQGMYQRGGSHADAARRRVERILLRRQSADGSWSPASHGPERQAGRSYATAMAILSLSVKHHFLPIYQR